MQSINMKKTVFLTSHGNSLTDTVLGSDWRAHCKVLKNW